MKIFIPCTEPREWYQIRSHRWTNQEILGIGPGTAMTARYTCSRCGRNKTVSTPG